VNLKREREGKRLSLDVWQLAKGKRESQLSQIINTDMLHLVVIEFVCPEIPIK